MSKKDKIPTISTLQATREWAEQYRQTLLFKRIAIIEAVAITGIIAANTIKHISPWKR